MRLLISVVAISFTAGDLVSFFTEVVKPKTVGAPVWRHPERKRSSSETSPLTTTASRSFGECAPFFFSDAPALWLR